MLSKFNLVGQSFGRWTVLDFWGCDNRRSYWRCRCACGTERRVDQSQLRSGKSRSCGCLTRDVSASLHTTHGWSRHRVCLVWHSMIARCHKPRSANYKHYGARGISVCKRWRLSLQNFIDDMGLPPSDKHSIDRIDNDGDYELANCRWVTQSEQLRNTRRNVMLTFDGKTQCLTDWAHELGVTFDLIYGRIRNGWSVEDALTRPRQSRVVKK